MCPHISERKSKPIQKSSGTKQSQNSYTISKRLLNERWGEHAKT
jgi:hypothetical protein